MHELLFDEATHTYTLDGEIIPSVTEILRFANHDLAVKADPWLRDIAAARGTKIHAICEQIDYGHEPEYVDAEIAGYVQAYKAFLRDYNVKGWLAVEKPVWGELFIDNRGSWLYAGTMDRLGEIDGKVVLVDIKTGSKVNKRILAAQLYAYHRATGLGINKKWGLQLKKDGTYRIIETGPYDGGLLFETCILLHNIMEGNI